MREIKVGKKYKHFKGHIVEVIAIGYDSESFNEENPDLSRLVVYKHYPDNQVWVRPYDMFNSLVDKDKYPDVEQTYRFEEMED